MKAKLVLHGKILVFRHTFDQKLPFRARVVKVLTFSNSQNTWFRTHSGPKMVIPFERGEIAYVF